MVNGLKELTWISEVEKSVQCSVFSVQGSGIRDQFSMNAGCWTLVAGLIAERWQVIAADFSPRVDSDALPKSRSDDRCSRMFPEIRCSWFPNSVSELFTSMVRASIAVSYTHLTLPTTPYV